MFRIPDGIDPKVKAVLQVIQGELYKLAKKGTKGGDVGGSTTYTIVSGDTKSGVGIPTETSGDQTIHGDLFVDGTIHGTIDGAVIGDLNHLTSDLSGSTLTLSDDAADQTLTGSLGDIDIVPSGGNVIFNSAYAFPAADGAANTVLGTNGAGALAWVTTNIDPTFADVTGSRAIGTIYQNTESTMKVVVISVELSG